MSSETTASRTVADLVAVEVFASKLFSITEEMAQTMIRTSGDPVIAEVNDFSTVLTDADGELLAYGVVAIHLGPARRSVRHLIETVPSEQIHPGDAWVCNDPYTTGNCHQPDLGIVRPIFYQGEHVAWCWAEAHMLDIGGMAPGGFASSAREVYGEALRFPGVKLISENEIIDDIWRLITANIRLPERNLNELRCFIAACNTAEQRLVDTIDEVGVESFRRYSEEAKDLSEQAVRRRISALPDGEFEARDYVEHNGHSNDLYEIRATVRVSGDRLEIDFDGTAAQTDGFVNCVAPAAQSVAITPLLHMLVPDVPVNEGLIRAIDWNMPAGTLVNPESPAPVSAGHMEAGMKAGRAVWAAASRLLSESDDEFLSMRPIATGHEAWIGSILYAPNEDGVWIPFLDMHGGGCGIGSTLQEDGLDAGGVLTATSNQLPDIETNEFLFDVLYLWRRLAVGTGGPGRTRGGLGIDIAFTPWRTPGGVTNTFAATNQIPATGIFGGYPGSGSRHRVFRGAAVDKDFEAGVVPGGPDDLQGSAVDLEAKHFDSPISAGDVLQVRIGGGGGIGDPLERDPQAVAEDVRNGYLDPALSESVYGVVLGGGRVDERGTEQSRDRIRAERRAWATLGAAAGIPAARSAAARADNPMVVERADGSLTCARCDSPLAEPRSPLHESVPARRRRAIDVLEELGGWCGPRDDVEVAEFACGSCGALVDVRVVVQA
jgi:N-methylhydantoinase B